MPEKSEFFDKLGVESNQHSEGKSEIQEAGKG